MLVRVRNPIPFSVKWQAQAKIIKKIGDFILAFLYDHMM